MFCRSLIVCAVSGVGHRLGIDFGTSSTVAVLGWPDGRVKPLLFDGSPLLPSAVCVDAAGGLLVGRDALHAAHAAADRFEPYPKRRIDDGTVLLGDAEVAVIDLVGAVLARVVIEARHIAGEGLDSVVLTCPAAWGAPRRELLLAAAGQAGLPTVRLVAEPVAAAAYFLAVAAARIPIDAAAVVYDLGAGTFDATVVRHTGDSFVVLATSGLDDTGGLDIDAAVMGDFRATYADRDPTAWRRITEPTTPADRRAARQAWENVRQGGSFPAQLHRDSPASAGARCPART